MGKHGEAASAASACAAAAAATAQRQCRGPRPVRHVYLLQLLLLCSFACLALLPWHPLKAEAHYEETDYGEAEQNGVDGGDVYDDQDPYGEGGDFDGADYVAEYEESFGGGGDNGGFEEEVAGEAEEEDEFDAGGEFDAGQFDEGRVGEAEGWGAGEGEQGKEGEGGEDWRRYLDEAESAGVGVVGDGEEDGGGVHDEDLEEVGGGGAAGDDAANARGSAREDEWESRLGDLTGRTLSMVDEMGKWFDKLGGIKLDVLVKKVVEPATNSNNIESSESSSSSSSSSSSDIIVDRPRLALVTGKDVEPGDMLLVIPRELWLSERHVAGDVVPFPGAEYDVVLAAWLLREVAKGEESGWAAYIRLLPKRVSVPMVWGEHALAALDFPPAIEQAQAISARIESAHAQCTPASIANATMQQFKWAVATVWSRVVPIAMRPSSAKLARSPSAHGSEEGEEGEDSVTLRFLVPFGDFAQHDFAPRAFWESAEEDDGSIQLIADGSYPAGTPVTVDYGGDTTSDFLHFFGFVPRRNPHDTFLVFSEPDDVASYYHSNFLLAHSEVKPVEDDGVGGEGEGSKGCQVGSTGREGWEGGGAGGDGATEGGSAGRECRIDGMGSGGNSGRSSSSSSSSSSGVNVSLELMTAVASQAVEAVRLYHDTFLDVTSLDPAFDMAKDEFALSFGPDGLIDPRLWAVLGACAMAADGAVPSQATTDDGLVPVEHFEPLADLSLRLAYGEEGLTCSVLADESALLDEIDAEAPWSREEMRQAGDALVVAAGAMRAIAEAWRDGFSTSIEHDQEILKNLTEEIARRGGAQGCEGGRDDAEEAVAGGRGEEAERRGGGGGSGGGEAQGGSVVEGSVGCEPRGFSGGAVDLDSARDLALAVEYRLSRKLLLDQLLWHLDSICPSYEPMDETSGSSEFEPSSTA